MTMMRSINAVSLAPAVNDWLGNTCHPRVLHVFDHVCNLVNERGDVLSVVVPQIGNGPFTLVVEDRVLFSEQVSLETQVAVSQTKLTLGNLVVSTTGGKPWNPQPDWGQLHSRKSDILDQLTLFSFSDHKLSIPMSLLSDLTISIVAADVSKARICAQKISGLGVGLTPEGDDFMVGTILAAWIIHPLEAAGELAKDITDAAAPLTTSLSAAWLKSAGRGEAGQVWHDLFDALLSADKMPIEESVEKILNIGHTSGADALAGFFSVLNSYAESKIKYVIS